MLAKEGIRQRGCRKRLVSLLVSWWVGRPIFLPDSQYPSQETERLGWGSEKEGEAVSLVCVTLMK